MKYLRLTLISVALAAASIGLGVASGSDSQDAARCQRCGDGFCAKSCENAQTCPQDCAPQTSRAQ